MNAKDLSRLLNSFDPELPVLLHGDGMVCHLDEVERQEARPVRGGEYLMKGPGQSVIKVTRLLPCVRLKGHTGWWLEDPNVRVHGRLTFKTRSVAEEMGLILP